MLIYIFDVLQWYILQQADFRYFYKTAFLITTNYVLMDLCYLWIYATYESMLLMDLCYLWTYVTCGPCYL